jgi:hypothetical protein
VVNWKGPNAKVVTAEIQGASKVYPNNIRPIRASSPAFRLLNVASGRVDVGIVWVSRISRNRMPVL